MSRIEKYRPDVPRLDPTPPEVFFNRRDFLRATGALMLAPAACAKPFEPAQDPATQARILRVPLERPDVFPTTRNESFELPDGLREDLTPRVVAASHNNFYEFLPGRGGPVWQHTDAFEVEPWTIEIAGECANPGTLDLDDLFAFPHEERLYHFRCVERWAMNVPWSGFPLRLLIEKAQPTSGAKFIRFVTANRPEQMPGIPGTRGHGFHWPYHEALRMDEAMNDLALVVTGVYGEPLLKQHGAPVRIIVPWKYGYKSPKSIVRIEFVREKPPTFWSRPPYSHEYGFLSNVNPFIPHPRWIQAESYWLDTRERFPTPLFNGYEAAVSSLYPDEPRTLRKKLERDEIAR